MEGLQSVKKNIVELYKRRKAAVYAICLKWGAVMLEYFHRQQPPSPGEKGLFWTSRTAYAAATFFYYVLQSNDYVALRVAHLAQYGIYLELANDRKHEAIRPLIKRYAGRCLKEIQELYVD